jgi:hypothetical protein
LLPKSGAAYHEENGDALIRLKKNSASFMSVAVDIFLNDDAYLRYPATIFVFDELARIYHEYIFSACLNRQLPVYWERIESRRNKHHIRSSLIMTTTKKTNIKDMQSAISSSKGFEDEVFNQKFQAYIEGFTQKGDVRLANSYMRLYKNYGLFLGKDALKQVIEKRSIGDLMKELGAEVRLVAKDAKF